jgi:hypothetical protein
MKDEAWFHLIGYLICKIRSIDLSKTHDKYSSYRCMMQRSECGVLCRDENHWTHFLRRHSELRALHCRHLQALHRSTETRQTTFRVFPAGRLDSTQNTPPWKQCTLFSHLKDQSRKIFGLHGPLIYPVVIIICGAT